MKLITTGMIPEEKLEEFRKLYFREYGVLLSDEENTKMAIDFLNLMRILTRPEPKTSNK